MLAPPVSPEAIFSNIIVGCYWIEYFQYKFIRLSSKIIIAVFSGMIASYLHHKMGFVAQLTEKSSQINLDQIFNCLQKTASSHLVKSLDRSPKIQFSFHAVIRQFDSQNQTWSDCKPSFGFQIAILT